MVGIIYDGRHDYYGGGEYITEEASGLRAAPYRRKYDNYDDLKAGLKISSMRRRYHAQRWEGQETRQDYAVYRYNKHKVWGVRYGWPSYP